MKVTCSNCGKRIPFSGKVCPWCHADKGSEKIIYVVTLIFCLIGALAGGFIFGGFLSAVIGAVIGIVFGTFAGVILAARRDNKK